MGQQNDKDYGARNPFQDNSYSLWSLLCFAYRDRRFQTLNGCPTSLKRKKNVAGETIYIFKDQWFSGELFPQSRGLRKRDPLSPYLFITVLKALSKLVKRDMDRGLLEDFHVRKIGPCLR